MNLSWYNENHKCPKCEHPYVDTHYCTADRTSRCRLPYTLNKEHIDRICKRCGYVWAETPLSSESRAKVEPTTKRVCDENCNQCPIILHPNNRMVTKVLNKLMDEFGGGVYKIVQDNCPSLTVCYDCRQDDFCHYATCTLAGD